MHMNTVHSMISIVGSTLPPEANISLVQRGLALLNGSMSGTAASEKDDQPRHDLLMQAIATHRDREAFAVLFHHFAPRVKGFLLRLGLRESAAEDLAQDVLLTVWRKAESYDPSQAAVSTWIFTIARNKRIDHLRRENRPQVDPTDPALVQDTPDQADELVAINDRAQRIGRAIDELPTEQAELVRLAFYRDLAHGQIALETGLPLGTVKSRLRLALEKLRRAVGHDE
tara:strand:- start:30675 stop:31358 length:684 start_codon:yes stop_codon:yes gene_type:complete